MKFTPNTDFKIEVDGYQIHTFFFEYKKENSYAIILHGLRADTDRMRPVIKLLKDKYNVISLDLPGFGLSKYDFEYDDYIRFCSGLLPKIIKELEIEKEETILFGASNGANIITDYIFQTNDLNFKKVVLFAPIYSNKNISMSKSYKMFVDWLSRSTAKGKYIAKLFQYGVDSDPLFNFFAKTFDKQSRDKDVLEYERKQWRLMTIQHWGKTLRHFLNIDYSDIKLSFNNDNVYFIFPHKDQYLDVEGTVNGFKNVFPNSKIFYYDSEEHIPRGDFMEDEKTGGSIKKIIEEI